MLGDAVGVAIGGDSMESQEEEGILAAERAGDHTRPSNRAEHEVSGAVPS